MSGLINVLITGASGFVGRAVAKELAYDGRYAVKGAIRRKLELPTGVEPVFVGDFYDDVEWRHIVEGCDVVIHTAARVHMMHDESVDPLPEFRRVNVHATLSLARQAVKVGVRRFIFISSIKVNGEKTPLGRPYTSADLPMPVDPYGISKYEAEEGLKQLAKELGLEVVIIRPVLVYGPSVKANFMTLMNWLYKGVPLPFGSIYNKRSLVALDNLADLICKCVDHSAAANQTFLVSDGEDLSTTELLRRVASALGKPARLLPVPPGLLKLGAAFFGKNDIAQRLLGSLQVDISHTKEILGWAPPVGVDEALKKTATEFLARQRL